MLLLDMMRAPEFTEEDYKFFEYICRAYLAYDPKYSAHFLGIMVKDPQETNFKFSAEGLVLKWIRPGENSGICGAFNPLWPRSFFLTANEERSYLFPKTKEDIEAEKAFGVADRNSVIQAATKRSMKDIKFLEFNSVASWMILQFPTISHELYHMFQYKTSKVGYIAMRLITAFTCIPYYLFQNAEWMPTFRKFFEWDLEGQAEKWGNNAPNMEAFCEELENGKQAFVWKRQCENSIKRYRQEGNMPEGEIVEIEQNNEANWKLQYDGLTPFQKEWGKGLYDLMVECASKY